MASNSNSITVRPAVFDDIPSMIALERQCLTAAHWTEQRYQQLFTSAGGELERLVLVARPSFPNQIAGADTGILGFLVASGLAPEWELENIVVAATARRQGVGKRLLDGLLSRAGEVNSEAVFLEVRESNLSARGLYEAMGFQATGRRPAHYIEPSEDAILYRFRLSEKQVRP